MQAKKNVSLWTIPAHVNKITVMFGFQSLVCFSVYRVTEYVIKKIMDLTFHLASRASLYSTTTVSI